MSAREIKFTETVWKHYESFGRHDLPWRKTREPYKVLVSEVMLQQTQALRVIPKYKEFLTRFPTTETLARAPLKDVLIAWQGLGYNRRAKALHEAVKVVLSDHRGRFPRTYDELLQLPGIGPYTAGAVMAFAFNAAVPILETNIRTVYLHHFFKGKTDVTDKELMVLVERTLDIERPRDWYYALMDYGSSLKRTIGNQNKRAKTYSKQSAFRGSDREVRGAIIRLLSNGKAHSRKSVLQALQRFEDVRVNAQLERLASEGMVARSNGRYLLPT